MPVSLPAADVSARTPKGISVIKVYRKVTAPFPEFQTSDLAQVLLSLQLGGQRLQRNDVTFWEWEFGNHRSTFVTLSLLHAAGRRVMRCVFSSSSQRKPCKFENCMFDLQ